MNIIPHSFIVGMAAGSWIVVISDALLLPGFGSAISDVTEILLVSVPVAPGSTVVVIVY
jgi:hypothetical protein